MLDFELLFILQKFENESGRAPCLYSIQVFGSTFQCRVPSTLPKRSDRASSTIRRQPILPQSPCLDRPAGFCLHHRVGSWWVLNSLNWPVAVKQWSAAWRVLGNLALSSMLVRKRPLVADDMFIRSECGRSVGPSGRGEQRILPWLEGNSSWCLDKQPRTWSLTKIKWSLSKN